MSAFEWFLVACVGVMFVCAAWGFTCLRTGSNYDDLFGEDDVP